MIKFNLNYKNIIKYFMLLLVTINIRFSFSYSKSYTFFNDFNDKIFSSKIIKLGLKNSEKFINLNYCNVYTNYQYKSDKLPILFVHGVNASPKCFKLLSKSINIDKYNPFYFYYPSGMRLSKISKLLYDKILLLKKELKFKRLILVAHSMGGLVSREFINIYNENQNNFLIKYISVCTPYGGVKAAKFGIFFGKVLRFIINKCWFDVVINSIFLKKLFRHKIKIKFFLFFGINGNNLLLKGHDDGAISVNSQLDYKAQLEAEKIFGINADHISILSNKEFLNCFRTIIA